MKLCELAKLISSPFCGDPDLEIYRLSLPDDAGQGDIVVIWDEKYLSCLSNCLADIILLPEKWRNFWPKAAIFNDNPRQCLALLSKIFNSSPKLDVGIHHTALISDRSLIDPSAHIGAYVTLGKEVKIGPNVIISNHCVIGDKVTIGSYTVVHSHVVIGESTKIGNRSVLQAGVAIGQEGFGFSLVNEGGEQKWERIPHTGKLIIGNDVEIGANTTISRGTIGDTVIEDGVKIDSQVHIAHNVKIGANTIIAGCVGIAGSSVIGKNCLIGGGSGISDHITITDNVSLTGMSMVTKSILIPGVYSSGTGLQENKKWQRNVVCFRRLSEFMKK